MKYGKYGVIGCVFFAFFILSCNSGEQMHKNESFQNIIDHVAGEDWVSLSQKRIYFGHQSVGYNIVDGIKDIMQEREQIDLNIIETTSADDFSDPVFAHSRIGQNTDLSSKMEAFGQTIRQGLGEKTDIAFFKFCYVDITEKTNVEKLFASYKQTMQSLQKEFSNTVFLYATVPLRTVKSSWKTWVKKLIGKDYIWEYADNIKRNEFNKMIREEYGDTGRIFDIARAESTYPNGKREKFKSKGTEYAALAPAYTDDGGHLNETGRKQVAGHLLSLMARVAAAE